MEFGDWLSAVNIVISLATLAAAVVAIWMTWWVTRVVAIRDEVRQVEPRLWFRVEPLPGEWPRVRLIVAALRPVARNLAVSLAAVDGPIWRREELQNEDSITVEIDLPREAALLRAEQPAPTARITYNDVLGNRYIAWHELLQIPRGDGTFEVRTSLPGASTNSEQLHVVAPRLRWRDYRRLRHLV